MIDWTNPINWNHHLNDGLLASWLVTPYNQGGTVLRDLTGLHDGALTNMDPATAWVNTDRRGSFGALEFESLDYVALPDAAYDIATGYTLSIWFNMATSTDKQLLSRDDSTGERFWQFRMDGSGVIRFIRFDAANNVVANLSTGMQYDGLVWHHAVATFDNSVGSAIYVDGKEEAFDGDTTDNRSNTGTIPALGVRSGEEDTNEPFSGLLSDARIYDRALSASEAAELHQLSQLGYPGIIRRVQDGPYWALVEDEESPTGYRFIFIKKRERPILIPIPR